MGRRLNGVNILFDCTVEPLESRQFFAATAAPLAAEPPKPFIARINFERNISPTPSGYLKDGGAAYGARDNGLTYGWSSKNNLTSDRNDPRSPDQRYDTFNRIQSSSMTWSLAVPNGRYFVRLISGDPTRYDSYYKSEVEGEIIVDGLPTSTNRWIGGSATVDVTDGRLTLRNVSGAANNKVNFIEVFQTDMPVLVTVGPENSGGFTRSGPADFILRPAGDPSNIAKVEFFSGSTKLGEDTAAPFGLAYTNVDPGAYSITTRITNKSGGVSTSQPVPLIVTESIVSLMTIGGSSSSAATRRVGWNIKAEGWQGFVDKIIQPQLDWGTTRILLSNPFGMLLGEQMQFDQYLHARAAGLDWLTNGFAQAWKPVTDHGIEVIAYLGNMEGDPNFSGSNWQQRFWDSIRPALDAGMSIGLDGAGAALAGSKTHIAAEMLRGLGVEVYVEARPALANTHWHDYGVISTDSFWDRSDPTRYADSSWAAPESMLKGEIIRLITLPPTGESWFDLHWVAPYARDIFDDGHSTGVGIFDLIRTGVSLEQLLA